MIPFISQLAAKQQNLWLAALNQALPDETLVHIDDIPSAEK